MSKWFMSIFVILMLSIACTSFAQCVPEKDAIATLDEAMSRWDTGSFGTISMTLECDPCRCPQGDNAEADCYLYRAQQAKARADHRRKAMDILNRLKKDGVCK